MRKSEILFALFGILLLATAATFVDTLLRANDDQLQQQQMVAELGLTDLSLFTEARYLRHLSQADLNTAFQDHPMALDYFPGGSLITPPDNWNAE